MKSLLTKRETQVMELLSKGRKNKEIARELGLAEHTIESHLQRIYEKLDVSNRTEAVLIFLTKKKFNGNP